ncbi:MAG: beta strand repeat-containing protein, partial [Actinomycetales bacterium]
LDVNGDINFTGDFYKNGTLYTSIIGSTPWATLDSNVYYTAGSVGVGTSTPEFTLDVVGDINFSGNVYQGGELFISSGSSGSSQWVTTGDDISYTTGNVSVSGNLFAQKVTLGSLTVSSGHNLEHVTGKGSTTSDTIYLTNPTTGLVVDSKITLGSINVFSGYNLEHITNKGSTTSDTIYLTNQTTGLIVHSNLEVGTDNLFVDATTGRIGAGTTTPGYKLDVSGDINFTGGIYQNGTLYSTASNGTPWSTVGSNVYYTAGSVGVGTAQPDATLHIEGNVYASSNLEVGTANLFVDTITGNVGIGKINPEANLDIVGTMRLGDGDRQSDFSILPHTGILAIQGSGLEVGTANLFVDTTTGRIGAGTATPGYNLDVNGDINFTGDFYKNGTLYTSIIGSTPWATLDSNVYYTAGSVGVGTSTPGFTLDVDGDINFSGNVYQGGELFISSGASGSSPWVTSGDDISYTSGNVSVTGNIFAQKITLGSLAIQGGQDLAQVTNFGSTTSETIYLTNPTTGLVVHSNLEVGTANLFVDATTGRIGAGTTTPGYNLDVNGDINFTGDFYKNGTLYTNIIGSRPWATIGSNVYYTAGSVG